MQSRTELPVAVIGGGPIGLAAAAHLVARGVPVKLYEAGSGIAANVRDWGHVRLFSPWRYNIDEAARSLLRRNGWKEPAADHLPTGAELESAYLAPLSRTPEMAAVIEAGARVVAITRLGIDKVGSQDRERRPFVLSVRTHKGLRRDVARAVIDASGTWNQPNPLGAGGVPADGEEAFADRIAYGIPDVLARNRRDYAGKTTLVVGAGYSAADVLLDLAKLREDEPGTTILWATRGINLARVYGGGAADQLPARGELGESLRHLVQEGPVTLTAGFAAAHVRQVDGRLVVEGEPAGGLHRIGPVDRIVVSTGQRPDLTLTGSCGSNSIPGSRARRRWGPRSIRTSTPVDRCRCMATRSCPIPSRASTRLVSRATDGRRPSCC